jgi:predicted MFS family arabinose efflux permease
MKPVKAHLALQTERNPFKHMKATLARKEYLLGFAATTLLATGGFMLMPFGSDFAVNNLGLNFEKDIFWVYLITGISTLIFSPMIGKMSDKFGKYKTFVTGSLVSIVLVVYYCMMGITPLWFCILLNSVLMISITSRMISASALMSAVPDPKDRGTYMGINSSFQQISGGFAAMIAGLIVVKTSTGKLENYDILGYVVGAAILVTIAMMYPVNKYVMSKSDTFGPPLDKKAEKIEKINAA